MSRTARLPRRVLISTTMALFAATSLALSGCAAGQYSQTADQVAAIDGANGTIGDIAVLNARLAPTDKVAYPEGSTARLLLWISNDALQTDTLNSISTPSAQSVKIAGDPTVPGQTLADFATATGTAVTVVGFDQEQFQGVSIPMTFSFAHAGNLTLNIPIEVPAERTGDREKIEILPPHPTPIWEEGGTHGEATGTASNEAETGHNGSTSAPHGTTTGTEPSATTGAAHSQPTGTTVAPASGSGH